MRFFRRDPIAKIHRQGKRRIRQYDKELGTCLRFPACTRKPGHRGKHKVKRR